MNIPEALKQHRLWLETSSKNGIQFNAREYDFSGADLSGADLSGADLSRANLSDINLSGADISGADISGANISGANLREADLSGAMLSRSYLREAIFSRSYLSRSYLSRANISGANLIGATLSNAYFGNAIPSAVILSAAILSNANLSRANLSGANLSRANLSGAILSNANFSNAILRNTNFSNANLSGADLSGADLSGVNLSGVNLSGANLREANLREANLSRANLSDANFSDANLSRVQALQTNLNGAVLTGACIEDWNINSKTELVNIICQAVYLRLNQIDDKYTDRRPSNEDAFFADGDFARLVRKAQDTVDLIFRNGIDWKALAISMERFKIESNGAELTIQAIENKGEGDFVIRVNVPVDANKSELEKFLKQEYEFASKALEAQYRSQLEAKDREIEIYHQQSTNLTEIMKLMASRPINVVNTAISESNSVSDNISINQSGAINPNASVAKDNARVQNILHNYPAEQQKSLAEAAAEIQQLLEQLSATNPTTTIAEKSAVATKAIETIEKNPTQKAKIVKALKVGGIAALKELVEPVMKPVTNILFPMLEELTKD